MRIGFDAKRYFFNQTGLGNYSRTLVNNLANYFPEEEFLLFSPREPKTTTTLPIYVPKTPFRSFWRSFRMGKQIERQGIDVFHGLSHELPFDSAKRDSFGKVVTIHDLIFKRYPETYSAIDRQIYDYKCRFACQTADRIIAISEATKRDIIEYYDIDAHKIEVVYQTINQRFWKPQNPEDTQQRLAKIGIQQPYLLAVGSLVTRKNIVLAVEAMALLPASLRIPLVIVGNGKDYLKKIIATAQQLGVRDLILPLTKVHGLKDLRALYHGAELLIYPSLYEGFGLPIAEALLCRTPVIAAAGSSLPEAGGPHTLYVDSGDPADLAKAIEKVLTNTELQHLMINEGVAYAKAQFDPKLVTSQVMDIYRKVGK